MYHVVIHDPPQMKQSGGDQGAFRILCDTYVTSDSGTGVVHQAPGFGEVR